MVTDDWDRVRELLRRTKKTTKSRYRASERLERHHKFSQWSVALLSCALIFIPLVQVFDVHTIIPNDVLSLTQAVLAVLVLVYSLLLGQEDFILRSSNMHKNGVELGRYARKLAGFNGS
ncbi:MAG: SLATT domain-containing protein, partial [Gammaproteobacteria bacterium]|nr:SLATT domain-containing protein [Gammaproteobacteria bacterium]